MDTYITDFCMIAGQVLFMELVEYKKKMWYLLEVKTIAGEDEMTVLTCLVPEELYKGLHFRKGSWVFVTGSLRDTVAYPRGGEGCWIEVKQIAHLKEERLKGYYNSATFVCWFPEETNFQVCLSQDHFLWQRLYAETVRPDADALMGLYCLVPREIPVNGPNDDDFVQITGALVMDETWSSGIYVLVERIDKPEDIEKAVPFLAGYEDE